MSNTNNRRTNQSGRRNGQTSAVRKKSAGKRTSGNIARNNAKRNSRTRTKSPSARRQTERPASMERRAAMERTDRERTDRTVRSQSRNRNTGHAGRPRYRRRRRKNNIFVKILIVILEAIQVISDGCRRRLARATTNDKILLTLVIFMLLLFGGSMFSVLGQKSASTHVTQDFGANAKSYSSVTQTESTAAGSSTTSSQIVAAALGESATQAATTGTDYNQIFANDCFIGDSRLETLAKNISMPDATFLIQGDLKVSDAVANSSIVSGLQNKKFTRIFIQIGINDVASYSESEASSGYSNLISLIRNYQPDASIYLESVILVTQAANDRQGGKLLTTIEKMNQVIAQVASANQVNYLDVTAALCGTDAKVLPSDAATDGILLNAAYCNKWIALMAEV